MTDADARAVYWLWRHSTKGRGSNLYGQARKESGLTIQQWCALRDRGRELMEEDRQDAEEVADRAPPEVDGSLA